MSRHSDNRNPVLRVTICIVFVLIIAGLIGGLLYRAITVITRDGGHTATCTVTFEGIATDISVSSSTATENQFLTRYLLRGVNE